MTKCMIIKALMLMWTHSDLDMNEQDRINAMNNTELVYDYSLRNNFDPFAVFSIVYNESRFRNLEDLNTASCGAFQIAHAYVPYNCAQLKEFRISLEIAFKYHILLYKEKTDYHFDETKVLDSKYKAPVSLKEILRLYASGPNCKNKKEECYLQSETKAKTRIKTRNKLHAIFIDIYKKYSGNLHLLDNKKCTK